MGNLSATLDHRGVHPVERTHDLLVHSKLVTIIIVRGCFHPVIILATFHLICYLRIQAGHVVFWSCSSLACFNSPGLAIANGLRWTNIILSGLTSSYVWASHERLRFHLFHGPLRAIAFSPDEEVKTIIDIARLLFLLLILFPLLIFLHCHQWKLHWRALIWFDFLLD